MVYMPTTEINKSSGSGRKGEVAYLESDLKWKLAELAESRRNRCLRSS